MSGDTTRDGRPAMKRLHLALLVFVALVIDTTSVSSLDLATRGEPLIPKPAAAPLILLVTRDGAALGGVALTAQ